MSQQIKERVRVTSGNRISQSGYYVYDGHLVDAENNQGCVVLEKAHSGLYLAKGSKAPGLLTCPHQVKWILDG